MSKVDQVVYDTIYQQYAEGTPLSTLAKRFGIKEPKLRALLKEYS